MSCFAIFALGVALSMDAMSASITQGLCYGPLAKRMVLRIAGLFGIFQAVMVSGGFFLGQQLAFLIQPIDHWIALLLLLFIGGNMIREGIEEHRHPEACELTRSRALSWGRLLLLAVATSIDAIAAGISLSIEKDLAVIPASLLIGVITFSLSYFGAALAARISARFKLASAIIGGLILIFIGGRVWFTHFVQGI